MRTRKALAKAAFYFICQCGVPLQESAFSMSCLQCHLFPLRPVFILTSSKCSLIRTINYLVCTATFLRRGPVRPRCQMHRSLYYRYLQGISVSCDIGRQLETSRRPSRIKRAIKYSFCILYQRPVFFITICVYDTCRMDQQ